MRRGVFFRVPMWFFEKPGVSQDQLYIVIYKAGYEEVWPRDDSQLFMKASKPDVKGRLDVMRSVVSRTSCRGNDKAMLRLYPLMVGLYEESLSLAGGKYDKNIVESFLQRKEGMEIGADRAYKQHLERLSVNK